MATQHPERRLRELGHDLVEPEAAFASFEHARTAGGLTISAAHWPIGPDGPVTGKLGVDLTVEEGYEAAQLATLHLLGSLRKALGDLSRIERFLYLQGIVNAAPEFTEHAEVVNGASDLLIDAFGDAGRHARLAMGVTGLPRNFAVEVQVMAATAAA